GIRAQAEWKVDTHIFWATGPTRAPTRSFISSAALLVKVMARMANSDTLRSRIRWATGWVSTRVLPDPAPATTRIGPLGWVTASRWTGFSPSSQEVVSKGSGSAVIRPPSYGLAVTAEALGSRDDQLEGAVGRREAGHLDVDEAGVEGRLPDVVLVQLLAALGPNRPERPGRLDPCDQ